jgi:hypothetical protein
MEWVLWFIAINWGIPLLTWIYPLFMSFIFGDFIIAGMKGPFVKFQLVSAYVEPWHATLWRDWAGVGLFGFMCYRDLDDRSDDRWVATTIEHEAAHCWQWLCLGLLFIISYLVHMAFIFYAQKDKHPYLDCWAERMARKKAGQPVDIPRENWPNGPKDRWPWW